MAKYYLNTMDIINKILKVFDFKGSVFWLTLFLGVILSFIGFQEYIEIPEYLKEIFKWGGGTLLSGVIIAFITSYAQYKGLYKNELEDVLYKYDFLKKRRDINEIWEQVSIVLFESKFPNISKELLDTIRGSYLPIEHSNYCRDADTIITIRWSDKENNIIEVVAEENFIIEVSSTSEFMFPGSLTLDVNPSSADIGELDYREGRFGPTDCSISIDKCEVNGVNVDPNARICLQSGVLRCDMEIKLQGAESYSLSRVMTRRYDLTYDYNIAFRAKTILQNLRVRVFNEIHDDIELCFVGRGVLNNFKEIKKRPDYLEKEYKGLILQKQGFIIILNKKQDNTTN